MRSPEPLDGVESGPTGRFPSMAEPSDTPFETMSGIPVEGVYGPDDAERPGTYPYTRGPYASMYRSKVWTMRMFAGFGTAIDTNARFKDLLANGGDGLSTAFDLPTLMGRDSDDELSLGEVGRCGVAVDNDAIYATELIKDYGVKNVIRVGSCGALMADIKLGEIIIAMGASTDSKVNRIRLMDHDYAAIADYDLLRTAADVAKDGARLEGGSSSSMSPSAPRAVEAAAGRRL